MSDIIEYLKNVQAALKNQEAVPKQLGIDATWIDALVLDTLTIEDATKTNSERIYVAISDDPEEDSSEAILGFIDYVLKRFAS